MVAPGAPLMGATIEYRPHERRWQPGPDDLLVFGTYRVVYPDGFVVLMAHTGYANTVGEFPMDIEDDEDRARLMDEADRVRTAHGSAS